MSRRSRPSWQHIVERTDTREGRAFDLVIQILIIVSLATFTIETLPGLSAAARAALRVVEVFVVLVFTIEYLLRVWAADRKRSYIFSFYGVIDLAAILPFYLATGVDLRSVRVVRLLRLVRIFRMVRYGAALRRFRLAFRQAKEELVLFVSASAITVYVASVGIYYFENAVQPELFASVFHSLWWSVVTLTTVGYGDVFPVTTGGRIFTGVVLLVGVVIIAVPAGVIASALSQVRQAEPADAPAADESRDRRAAADEAGREVPPATNPATSPE